MWDNSGFYSIKCFVDLPSPGRVIDARLETATAENIVSGGDAAAMCPGSLLRKKGTGFKTQTCEIKYRCVVTGVVMIAVTTLVPCHYSPASAWKGVK